MKKIRILIIVLVGALLLGMILYYIPQRRQVSMWVCNASGEAVLVEIDIEYSRRLFGEPVVRGTVTFNGEEYIDGESMLKTFPENQTHNAEPEHMVFYKKSIQNIMDMGTNQIHFWDVSDGYRFEKVFFTYLDESMEENGHITGIPYAGPAQTAEEAQELAAGFGLSIEPLQPVTDAPAA